MVGFGKDSAPLGTRFAGLLALFTILYVIAVWCGIPHYMQFWVTVFIILFALAISRIRKNKLVRALLMSLGIVCSLRFLHWRLAYTISLDSPFNAITGFALFLAELHTALVFFTVCFQTLELEFEAKTPPLDPEFEPEVNIFITTYNEPPDIVRRTAAGAMRIDYPNKRVYILDDGRRQSILELAEHLGCEYITRPNNHHYKAGNINNALKHTESEFVLFLDADHVPCTTVIRRMLPHFKDPKVGIVQTAHRFLNPAPVEQNLYLEADLPNEQEFFFQIIQRGKSAWGAAIFCGSTAMIRRKVLDELGGMATQTLTEDAEFTLKMNRKGYRLVYLPDPQSIGLNPESLAAYLIQQRRWCRGAIQMFMLDNPFIGAGLSIGQRICYAAGAIHYLFGLPRLLFIVLPLIYLLLGIRPINATWLDYFVMGAPYLVVFLLSQNYIFDKYRHTFWSDVYEVISAPHTAYHSLVTVLRPRAGRFAVTPKGLMHRKLSWNLYLVSVQAILLFFCCLGVIAAIIRLMLHVDPSLVVINLAWDVYNMVVLVVAILVALERPQSRRTYRVNRQVSVTAEVPGLPRLGGFTMDLNEFGAKIQFAGKTTINPGEQVTLAFEDRAGELIEVAAVRAGKSKEPSSEFQFQFLHLDKDAEKYSQMVELTYCSADMWKQLHSRPDTILHSLGELLLTPVRVLRYLAESKRTWQGLAIVVPKRFYDLKLWPEKMRPALVDADAIVHASKANFPASYSDMLALSEDEADEFGGEEDYDEDDDESPPA